jgi:aldehyde:ferredoxin oxidoreductase
MHVGGQEPGLHNVTFLPGRGTGFVADPTPGRHTAAGPYARCDVNAAVGPYEELRVSGFERYQYTGKGPATATSANYWQVGTSAGLCLLPVIFSGVFPLLEFINGVTGWDLSLSEALKTGARIQTIRQLFNSREGIAPSDFVLPDRMTGIPPQSEGPLKGITIDINTLVTEYRKAMDWDPESGEPSQNCLNKLGLLSLVKQYA